MNGLHARLGALVLALLLAAGAARAAKTPRGVDHVWTHPEYASLNVRSIAMFPGASFARDIEVEKMVQSAWGRSFAGTGYRWVSATTVRDMLKASADGDSLLKRVRESVLANDRIDSLLAPVLCTRLRTNAVLSVRVDQWEQVSIQPGQSGTPSTSIQLKAALVDSLGRLAWTASGSETVQGIYQEASPGQADFSGSAGTRSTGLHGSTAPGAAPAYGDVLDRLLTRWVKYFPGNTAATPAK